MQGGPLMHVIAAKAVAFNEDLQPSFKEYNDQIVKNAKKLASVLMENGLKLVTDGTDNHLMLIDLRKNNLTGKEVEKMLGEAKITVNKNTIPYDPQKPFITSGIRVGVPAITTRGMKEKEMEEIGKMIAEIINSKGDLEVIKNVKMKVEEMVESFPLYQNLRK